MSVLVCCSIIRSILVVRNLTNTYIQFLEGMSEKIIQGIQSAQSDIHKEKEQKEQEEVRVSSGSHTGGGGGGGFFCQKFFFSPFSPN